MPTTKYNEWTCGYSMYKYGIFASHISIKAQQTVSVKTGLLMTACGFETDLINNQ